VTSRCPLTKKTLVLFHTLPQFSLRNQLARLPGIVMPEAVSEADDLVQRVMRDRGYPVDDFEQRAADISVEHPELVERYRTANGIARASERGEASTEDLRHSVRHYRALFVELLEVGDDDRGGNTDDVSEDARVSRLR